MVTQLIFNLPEEQQLLQDYQDGIKCKWMLQDFLQRWTKTLKNVKNPDKVKAQEVIDSLYRDLEDNDINIFG